MTSVRLPSAVPAPTVPPRPRRGWNGVRVLLGMPLLAKLLGANLAIVVTVATVATWRHVSEGHATSGLALLIGVLVAGFLVNLGLVLLALRPIGELEHAAVRAARGDLESDIVPSALSDDQLTRVSRALNTLVGGLRADRMRMRQLAVQVIRAQDDERSRIARELHDSTAQTMAAIQMQLSAATRQLDEGSLEAAELAERLASLRDMAGQALEEVRLLSHTVYPRILDDLGLASALEWLVRRTRDQHRIAVWAVVEGEGRVSPTPAAALYRVAQEALRNAVVHSGAREVTVRLTLHAREATLEVHDDGRGFDATEAENRRPGMGLFSMRERVALVNGTFRIDSRAGGGTTVHAAVPLEGGRHEQ